MNKHYLFQSERLGFRNWMEQDIPPMIAINQDTKVMRFFPKVATSSETRSFVKRMQAQQDKRGFCYFAVDLLRTGTFIGFIGLSEQKFPADFTPCIDIGWRLAQNAWGKGLATEGAKSCLTYALEELGLKKIYALAPLLNIPSIQIMKKIGMKKVKVFQHPLLSEHQELQDCVLYELKLSDG